MQKMVEEYERCWLLEAYSGQACELCPHRGECSKENTVQKGQEDE